MEFGGKSQMVVSRLACGRGVARVADFSFRRFDWEPCDQSPDSSLRTMRGHRLSRERLPLLQIASLFDFYLVRPSLMESVGRITAVACVSNAAVAKQRRRLNSLKFVKIKIAFASNAWRTVDANSYAGQLIVFTKREPNPHSRCLEHPILRADPEREVPPRAC
jgi:hypothetical protein